MPIGSTLKKPRNTNPIESYNEITSIIKNSPRSIFNKNKDEMSAESPRLSNMISTRMSVEIAGLLSDGFGLDEASQIAVYPFFDADGGLDSERTYIKQLVQKYLGSNDEELFTEQDMNESDNN